MDHNVPFSDKLNFASFQNGGYAQNGSRIGCLTITQSIINIFMFSLLLLVSDHKQHKSYKKVFFWNSKWCLKFKMAANFQ
jgi:hypothetical protein